MPPSLAKKLLLSLVSIIVTLLLITAVEVALRRLSPSAQSELVTEVTYDGINWFETNRQFLKKYFPAGSPSIPEFKTSLFRKEKAPNAFRIMCLGSSSMFGTPYDMNANIPGIVRRQLRHLYPDREFEVINWGASAINSNVICDFAPRLLAYQPDLVLVYMGHNEFYGPDGVGASFLEKHFPSMTRVKYWARELRIVQGMQSLIAKLIGTADRKEVPNLMKQVSEGSLISLRSPDAERVFDNFENNLDAITETFIKAGVPLILSEVSSNMMFPPFVSDSVRTIGSSTATFHQILDDFTVEDFSSVLATCDRLRLHDSTNAFIEYWGGRALYAVGRFTEARRRLLLARDNDLLKFRAPSQVNSIIRSVCQHKGISLVAADSLFAALSQGGVPGDSLFWEHLHPTLRGYYLLAGLFVNEIVVRNLILPPPAQASLLPCDVDSLHICWLDRAYADLSIQHLTGRWPFQNYQRSGVVLGAADPMLQRLVQDVYDRKLQWNEACYRSAALFWGRGDLRNARTTYEALLEEYPFSFYSNYLIGSLLNHMHRLDEAVAFYRRSIESNPRYSKSSLDLGLIEVNRGNFDEAVSRLQGVLMLEGDQGQVDVRATALYGLGAAFANLREFSRAMAHLDQALMLKPDYVDAQRLKAAVKAAQ